MQKEFRLQRIELCNVFNYRGKHNIDFNTGRDGNIFLFNIQNGGGKTSLFLAIKWGFYGRDSGIEYIKDGIRLSNKDFMNQDAMDENGFHVKIWFDYDGRQMELRRECPDFRSENTVLTLKVDGVMERDNTARTHVAQIIPPDYGDFFMFNGEVLQEIANNQRDVRKTDGVLKLLGLKQLNDLKDELSTIQRGMSAELSRMSEAGSQFSQLNEELSRFNDKYDRITKKLEQLREELNKVQGRIWQLEEDRRSYSNKQSTIESLERLKGERESKQGDLKYISKYIREHSEEAFILFIKDDIDGLLSKLKDEKISLTRENRCGKEVHTPGKYLEAQQDIVKAHLMECPVCRSAITPDILKAIEDIISTSTNTSKQYVINSQRIRELNDIIELLRERRSQIPDDLDRKCSDLFDVSESINKLDADIQRLNGIISDSDIDAVKQISGELANLYRKKTETEREIFNNENLLKNTEENLRKVRKKINNTSGMNAQQKQLSNRSTFLDNLVRKLELVIESASRNKRRDILAKADMVFMDITNKPDIYKGLEYDDNDSFAMHIVRRDGKSVMHPSSGEKHVLAISFLISLSLNTERPNPMMMDTPLSRLDVVHKKNIGNALSHLSNQVIFLAQPGEMDSETFECFKPAVAKMFESRPDENNGACIREVEL